MTGVAVVSAAASRRSSKSFIAEQRLEKVLNSLAPGDYLFINSAIMTPNRMSGGIRSPSPPIRSILVNILTARGRGGHLTPQSTGVIHG